MPSDETFSVPPKLKAAVVPALTRTMVSHRVTVHLLCDAADNRNGVSGGHILTSVWPPEAVRTHFAVPDERRGPAGLEEPHRIASGHGERIATSN